MTAAALNSQQQQRVSSLTDQAIEFLADQLKIKLNSIDVLFDLKGRTAGMYVRKHNKQCIRYNPYIFEKYYPENVTVTIPHEVAHYAADCLYGMHNIKPHGKEWKSIMSVFGADDRVTCDFDFSDMPVRQYMTVTYRCQCRSHRLTKIRHNRMQRGARYHCRYCKSGLILDTQ